MSKTDVWMPIYIGDYLKDTTHLSTVEHGAYFLLLMAYWNNGGPLPDNERRLAAVAKVPVDEWPHVWTVLQEFFQITHEGWRHKRIDTELQKAAARREIAAEKGRKGAAKRYGDGSCGYAPAMPQLQHGHSSSPSPSPVSTNVDTKTPYTGGDVEVKLPDSFPKDEQDAIARCMTAGVPDDFIKDVYHKALSRGGKDAREIPIAVWPSYVKTEWKYEQNRKEKDRKPAPHPQHRPEGIQPRML